MEVLTIGQLARQAGVGGFALKGVQELLALRVDPDSTCSDVRGRARDRVADTRGRIESLQRMKGALERLAGKCLGQGPTTECPILEELDRGEDGHADG